jgi:glycosyltransferase involved in cell wall biosynthesis
LSAEQNPTFHVVLRRDAEEPFVKSGATGGISATFRRLQRTSHSGAFRFYCDTEELSLQYSAIAPSLAFGVLPIVHTLPTVAPRARPRGAPLTIAYLGNARREKGFHLLPDAFSCLARPYLDSGKVRCIVQANDGVKGGEIGIGRARKALQAYPAGQIFLIDKALSPAEFHETLLSADIILLPYEAERYLRRSSGIMVQALAAGIPVVVPAGTWLSSQVDQRTARFFEKPADLGPALIEAIEAVDELSEHAASRADMVRHQHSASRYIEILMKPRR